MRGKTCIHITLYAAINVMCMLLKLASTNPKQFFTLGELIYLLDTLYYLHIYIVIIIYIILIYLTQPYITETKKKNML